MPRHLDLQHQRGAALVVTLIVLVVLAAVAVAFMQNTGLDRSGSRSAANVYRARLAAEAGLAEAMGLIQQNLNNFAYTTGSKPEGDGYRTFIRPLKKSSKGTWEFDGDPVNLDSGVGGEDVGVVLTGTRTEPELEQKVSWKSLSSSPGDSGPVARYAFWVDEGGAKQNLAWWGGSPPPAKGNSLTNLAQLSLSLPDKTGQSASPFPQSALQSIVEQRKLTPTNFTLAGTEFNSFTGELSLPTVATVNLLDDQLQGRVNSYFFTLSSASGAASPSGTPKLNLTALARHVKNLNSEQGADSPKAKLVDDLLKEKPENAASWGGGSLRWLADSGKYSEAEQKQIVANIIDYLDEDLAPTTDNVTSPTYFGVEYKLDNEGKPRGHPVIAHLGFGLQFNISGGTSDRPAGTINSSRILCALGLVNVWPVDLEKSDYEVKVTVRMEGKVTGSPSKIEDYFEPVFNERLTGETWEGERELGANSFFLVAGKPNLNLRAMKDFLPKGLVNVGATFSDVKYRVENCQVVYSPTGGQEPYVVSSVAGLPTVDAKPATFTLPVPNARMTLTYATGEPDNELYLSSDPRAAFKSQSFTSSGTTYTKNLPAPETAINLRRLAGTDADEAQEVPTIYDGLASTYMTNHISRASESGMSSVGELGYIWTGKPWQTLNLLKTDSPQTADWNLLDYVSAGRMATEDGQDAENDGGVAVAALPLAAPFGTEFKKEPGLNAVLLSQGGFNINTRKRATVQAVLDSAEGISKEAADAMLGKDSGSQASAFGEIATMAPDLVEGKFKFQREAAQRALANIAVNHSRVFTVYSAGEYRQGNSSSRVQLEADIFVGVDPETGDPLVQIINKRFL